MSDLVTHSSFDSYDTDGYLVRGRQYAVMDASGHPHVYGDQRWVEAGHALEDHKPGAKVVRRTVTIIYGDWTSEDGQT